MSTTRRPAISRTTSHPADAIPDRPAAAAPVADVTTSATSATSVVAQSVRPRQQSVGERFTEQHNVRIRPSVKERLGKAVDKLRYETGDRSISIASITDQALDDYLTRYGC